MASVQRLGTAPNIFTVEQVVEMAKTTHVLVKEDDGSEKWYPCRPEGWDGLFMRCKLAWKVFTGRADALVWPKGQ